MKNHIVKVESLTKTYQIGDATVYALNNISFHIKEKTFVSVIGKSGSGKSTLLHMLGGLDSPTQGKVFIDNVEITAQKEKQLSVFRRQNIGFVFQFFDLIEELNVKENIMFPVLLDKKEVDMEYFEKLVSLLGLQERLGHLPSQLSGGQQQRAAIARALISKPKLILMDEPTGNLDETSARAVIDLIQLVMKHFHTTIIVVTHDADVANAADTMLKLKDGALLGEPSL